MSTQYIAVPNGHTIVHLQILEYYTFTTRVYNRLIAAGHADFVGKAIMGFPDRIGTHADQSEGGTVAPDNGVRPPRPHAHRVLRRAAPPARRGSGGAAPSTRPVRKAKRRIRRRWSRAMKGKRCPFLRNMTDERILALDEDLDRRRNAFLAAQTTRDAQVQVASPTHDVVHRPPAEGRALDAILAEATCPSDVITPHAPAESLSEGSCSREGLKASNRPIGDGRALNAIFTEASCTSDANTPHTPGVSLSESLRSPDGLEADRFTQDEIDGLADLLSSPTRDVDHRLPEGEHALDASVDHRLPGGEHALDASPTHDDVDHHPPSKGEDAPDASSTLDVDHLSHTRVPTRDPDLSLSRGTPVAPSVASSQVAAAMQVCMYPLPPPNSFHLPTTLWEGQQRTVDACPRWVQWHTGSLPEC